MNRDDNTCTCMPRLAMQQNVDEIKKNKKNMKNAVKKKIIKIIDPTLAVILR